MSEKSMNGIDTIYKRISEVEVTHKNRGVFLDPEPCGIFELGLASFSGKKYGEQNGFYIIKWPLGKFYLSSEADYETMQRLLEDYVGSGRNEYEYYARQRNDSRPTSAFPDDGHWVEQFLKSRNISCSIITPKIRFEHGHSPSLG